MIHFRCLVLILLVAAVVSGCAAQPAGKRAVGPAQPIKIGIVVPVTGPVATFGKSTRQGAEMVFGQVNRAGGVLGRKIEVLVEDDAGKPEEVSNVFTKLVDRNRVTAIIGAVTTACSLAGAPICQR